jgi:DUF1680 family protein
MMGAIPDFIYSVSPDGIRVNLFMGSGAEFQVENNKVSLQQVTNYPWDGKVTISVDPQQASEFVIKVRIPGWAVGDENPLGLYHSQVTDPPTVAVNGSVLDQKAIDGYVSISRNWKKGDKIELNLPMKPRLVYANDEVQNLSNMASVASGPLVYCFENNLNTELDRLKIGSNATAELKYQPDLLNGVNTIVYKSTSGNEYKAIPYYAVGNVRTGDRYQVWVPVRSGD